MPLLVQLLVRYLTDLVWHYHIVSGIDAMSLIGFHPSYYKNGMPYTDDSLLLNMAGNAYSGFAVTPLLMAAFSLAGRFAYKASVRSPDFPVSVASDSQFDDSASQNDSQLTV